MIKLKSTSGLILYQRCLLSKQVKFRSPHPILISFRIYIIGFPLFDCYTMNRYRHKGAEGEGEYRNPLFVYLCIYDTRDDYISIIFNIDFP